MVEQCACCGDERRPKMYRDDGRWFCDGHCLRQWWGKQAEMSAAERNLCVKCWAKHDVGEKCVEWVTRKS